MADQAGRVATISWVPLPPPRPRMGFAVESRPPPSAMVRAFQTAGVPVVAGAQTAREAAIELLKLAAEVEHALMVQYLYLALSIPPTDQGENHNQTVLAIAIEEMGHLATVQNLLLMLGGPGAFHMQRDVLRAASSHNPIPFVLEPLSRAALAKFVAAEAPAQPPAGMAAKVAELVALATQSAGAAPQRVGAIYGLIEWMFMTPEEAVAVIDLPAIVPLPDDPHIRDEDIHPVAVLEAHEALGEEWGDDSDRFLLFAPRTRADALAALRTVATQGEGAEDAEGSHFRSFMALTEAFDAGQVQGLALPVSPSAGANGGERPTPITNAYAALWAEAFDLQYGLVVLSIRHALATARGTEESDALRAKLADLALRGMRTILLQVGGLIGTLPLADGEARAGPPFALDPAWVPDDPAAMVQSHKDRITRLETLYGLIEASPDHPAAGDPVNRLRDLRGLDRRRLRLFDPTA